MADSPQPLDGISPPAAAPAPATKPAPVVAEQALRKKRKTLVVMIGAGVYFLYAMWGLILITLLPSTDLVLTPLVGIGVISALFGAFAFIAVGALGFLRISKAKVPVNIRTNSLIRLGVVVVPGLLLSIAVPILISAEPPLVLTIVSPAAVSNLIAPVTISFSAEEAVKTLGGRGVGVSGYRWDVNGDGKVDQDSISPKLTVNFEREGAYTVVSYLTSSDGKVRPVVARFTIRQSVFSIIPSPPIVKKPVVFSISNLIKDKTTLKEVQWDFNDDGKADETSADTQMAYTFFKTGDIKITAVVVLQNGTQASYSRIVTVEEPKPLPFDVSILTEPKNLISPAPFPVLFRMESKVPLAEVTWDFGDGEKDVGDRVLHEFAAQGTYVVTTRVRAQSGTAATLDTLVRVVEELPLPDLQFESTVPILGNTIEGTVPLRLNITPSSSVQFVQFSWEAPNASEVTSTEGTLQAVYRKEGTYKVVLLAQDVVNRATRREFTVSVKPQQAIIDFQVLPDTGVAPLTVQLDSSDTFLPIDETPTGYLWKCEDRAQSVARGGISSCRYTEEGTYQITFTVRTQSGKEYSKTKTIVVRPPVITACFLPTRSTAKVGQLIGFPLECSSGGWEGMNVLWDFGDRTQVDWKQGDEDVVHAYTEPGTFTVTLTFTDPNDSSRQFKTTRTVTITP